MTLVAVIYAEHTPLVITDSLVSQEDAEANGVTTPLLSKKDMRSGSRHAPVGIARKFWLLPDGSLFFYSGTIGSARQLFDELGKYLSKKDRYGQEYHSHALDYLKRIPKKFSFLVAVPGEAGVTLWTHGVIQEELRDYGMVVLLGSGKESAKVAMAKFARKEPIDKHARLLNAYNLAARFTLDYQDRGRRGSEMAASSCGGYFEVVEPSLYAQASSSLYRGTAHLFFQISKQGIRLDEFFASSQRDEETRILRAFDLCIHLDGPDFLLDDSLVHEFVIGDDKSSSGPGEELKGHVPFSHIRGAILYASMVPECGLEEHRMQTHTVLVGPGFPAATLMPSDNHEGAIHVSLFANEGDPVKALAERLRKGAQQCFRCQERVRKQQG